MKKMLFSAVTAALIFVLLSVSARAADYSFGQDRLADALPAPAADTLAESGITPDGGAEALTFEGVLQYLWGLVTEQATAPLKLLTALCGVILLCGISASVADGGSEKLSGLFTAVGVLSGAGITVAAMSEVLTRTLDLLSAASVFITAFIPIFAGILAVMGKATAATAANTVTLAATQLFSQLSVNFLAPLCGTVMGLSITGAIHPQLDVSRIGELIKKGVVWVLGLLMTVFMSILSAQTFVTNSADSMLIRTAKFAVSSGVPIVGGTISDAVYTVHGSLMLIKSSVGIYGIIAVAVIILPTLINVSYYRLAVAAAEALADIMGVKELASLMKACGGVMSIITAVIVCFLLLNTFAAVIMLSISNGSA